MDIKLKIASDLDVPQDLIKEALSVARTHVKKFDIKKRNGKPRTILQPSKKLKTIQYWLILNVFNNLPVHEAAIAYREGISILHNAKRHRNNRYFLKMDFKDFFPSIKWADLLPIIESWYKESNIDWELNEDAKYLIRHTCFYHNDILPIGYPSSPVISNAVMYPVDINISRLVSDSEKYGNAIYTRYSDDIVISTDKKGACRLLLSDFKILIGKTSSPNISINNNKTKIGSSTGGSASVTGLKICSNGHITLHRKHKDHIRLLLSLYKKGMLEPDEHTSLLGHLAYAHYTAPDFYTKLQNKFFKEIESLRALSV